MHIFSEYINGIRVFIFSNKKDLLDYVRENKGILVAINAEKILKSNNDLKKIINNNIGYADGIGAVWALKKEGYINAIKIPGSELWLDIIKEFHEIKTFYLIGSQTEVINNVYYRLLKEFPSIKILGFRNGFFRNEDDFQDTIVDITVLKPDIIFVAQGSPLQEFTMNRLNKVYPAIYVGLGGSFDIYSGLKKRAPKFFLNNNMEWLYRLLKEPLRIKRQWALFKFVILLYLNRLNK